MYVGVFLIWFIGVLAFSVYLYIVNLRYARKINRGFLEASDRLTTVEKSAISILQQCRYDLHIKRAIPFELSNEVDSPTLYGMIRPRILLPAAGFERFSDQELRHIFLHELVHYKRKDIWVNWIMSVLLIMHWFNPILWYTSRKMREDQELSCDAKVMSLIHADEAKDYGQTLIKLIESSPSHSSQRVARATFTSNRSLIKRRIKMIAMFKRRSYKWAALGLAIVMVFASVALTNASAETSNTSNEEMATKSEIQAAYLNNPKLDKIDSSIRKNVEQTIIDVMVRYGKTLPIKKISLNIDKKEWFIEFTGESTELRYIFVNAKTGAISVENLGVPLVLDKETSILVQQAKKVLKEKGYDGNLDLDFKVLRSVEGTEIWTNLQDKTNQVEVQFAGDRLVYVRFPISIEQVTVEQEERGRQALTTLRGKKEDYVTRAVRFYSDTYNYLKLHYGADSIVNYDLFTNKIHQVSDSSLMRHYQPNAIDKTTLERNKKWHNISNQQVLEAATPIVQELLGVDIHDYKLQMDKKTGLGAAHFIKDGKTAFTMGYNEDGVFGIITNKMN